MKIVRNVPGVGGPRSAWYGSVERRRHRGRPAGSSGSLVPIARKAGAIDAANGLV